MKIEKEELMTQLQEVIKDEFVAEVSISESGLSLRFLNGQKFNVTIEEE